ncbi:ABC transporter ATP-binding protein [uncultured Ruthenibacterium sp.]|uniref:ABC transporter ATP-binding protein n=1 Tax=uncultured Ruthenibacterium sp. TaxID=1905347 RepID=UPI00349EEF6B
MNERKDVLLQVEQLNTYFKTENGRLQAVRDVSFQVRKGELLGVVGESGCGKSITSLSIMGLQAKNCEVEAKHLLFEGKDLVGMSDKEMRMMRGKDMAMIFQEPLTSLNPLFTIGYQLTETLRLHNKVSKKQATDMAIEMLKKVEIPRPEHVMKEYPNALSGGMRQRVMIAIALANNPKLLIADEPTTALDVTIQAQILRLMKHLMKEYDTAIMLITHDLGVVAEVADYVLVMYAGQVVEEASVYDLFAKPLHPYTKGLMNSTIKVNQTNHKLDTIKGTVPSLADMPEGCRFHPRCPYATDACRSTAPDLLEVAPGRKVRCLRWQEIGGGKNG